MPTLSAISTTQSSITWRISVDYPVNSYDYFQVLTTLGGSVIDNSGQFSSSSSGYSVTYTTTGLSPNTTYVGNAVARRNGVSSFSNSVTVTTDAPAIPPPSTPWGLSNGTDGLTAYLLYSTDSYTEYVEIDRYWSTIETRYHGGGSWYAETNVSSYNSAYQWRIRAGNSMGVSSWSPVQTFFTNWNVWDKVYQGGSFNITASNWNDFIDYIKSIYNAKGWSLSSYPMSYVNSSQTFLADRFNEVRFAIGSKVTTGISTKYSGDPILANDFYILQNSVNQMKSL